MNKTIWKALFFIMLTVFLLLTVLLLTLVYGLLVQPPTADTGIIGGASLHTHLFLIRTAFLHSPIPSIWLGALLAVIVSFIGWRTCKN